MKNIIYRKRISATKSVGIMLAKDWFELDNNIFKSHSITEDDYVVCTWYHFHDGVSSNVEGKETVAICRNKKDAELIFDSK